MKKCYLCKNEILPEEDNGSWICRKCQKEEQERLQRYSDKEESDYTQQLESQRKQIIEDHREGCPVKDPNVNPEESTFALQIIANKSRRLM